MHIWLCGFLLGLGRVIWEAVYEFLELISRIEWITIWSATRLWAVIFFFPVDQRVSINAEIIGGIGSV